MKRLLILLAAVQAFGATVRIGMPGGPQTIPLEEYAAGVLAAECKTFRSIEAIQAMAVAARTYAVALRSRHEKEGFDLCRTTHCQAFQPAAIDERVRSAVQATSGELLWYRGSLAFTYYAQDCGGRTEAGAVVWPELAGRAPYLQQHDDPYCTSRGRQQWSSSLSVTQIAEALRTAGLPSARVENLTVRERTPSGRVRTVLINQQQVAASSFRFAIDRTFGWNQVRSNWFDVRVSGSRVSISGIGAGHGVGMCQHGADAMGLVGQSYRQILAEYYPGTVVGLSAAGIAWQKLAGEQVELWTTAPAGAGHLLPWMERVLVRTARELETSVPTRTRIQVFPTVAMFRDATGEPGWAAASTRGITIRLAPAGVNVRTLHHEACHLLMNAMAGPALPLWFREGLVLELTGEGGTARRAMAASQIDTAIAQTRNAALARQGYAAARQKVQEYIARYGRAAVLSWVRHGVPPALSAATIAIPAHQSK